MVNYQLGKIYKIVDLDSNECYVGSTCEPTLTRRLAKHVGDYKQYPKGKGRNITSYIILAMDDYDIVLVENYPCNSKDELHARERYYSQLLPCVNKNKNQGLIHELGQKEYKKQHYKANKEQIQLHNEQQFECQCGCTIQRISDKARHFRSIKHKTWLFEHPTAVIQGP
jgi:hypothetical protein